MGSVARCRGDRGAVLVEFAITFPVLASMLYAGITTAMVLSERSIADHAAREGARFGATLAWDQEFHAGNWADAVDQQVRARVGKQIDADAVCVALVEGVPGTPVSSAHTNAPGGGACWDDGSPHPSSRVQVEIRGSGTIDAIWYRHDLTLQSRSVAHSERVRPEDNL